MKKSVKKRHPYRRRDEVIFSAIIATVLVVALVVQSATASLPHYVILFLLAAYIAVRVFRLLKEKETHFEEYAILFVLVIFLVLRTITFNFNINAIIAAVGAIAVLYSAGIIPKIHKVQNAEKVWPFIISYLGIILLLIFLYAGTYLVNDSMFTLNGNQVSIDALQSVYFSTITFTAVGYGDYAPIGVNRAIATIEALTGVAINIGFVGYVLATRRFKKS